MAVRIHTKNGTMKFRTPRYGYLSSLLEPRPEDITAPVPRHEVVEVMNYLEQPSPERYRDVSDLALELFGLSIPSRDVWLRETFDAVMTGLRLLEKPVLFDVTPNLQERLLNLIQFSVEYGVQYWVVISNSPLFDVQSLEVSFPILDHVEGPGGLVVFGPDTSGWASAIRTAIQQPGCAVSYGFGTVPSPELLHWRAVPSLMEFSTVQPLTPILKMEILGLRYARFPFTFLNSLLDDPSLQLMTTRMVGAQPLEQWEGTFAQIEWLLNAFGAAIEEARDQGILVIIASEDPNLLESRLLQALGATTLSVSDQAWLWEANLTPDVFGPSPIAIHRGASIEGLWVFGDDTFEQVSTRYLSLQTLTYAVLTWDLQEQLGITS